MVELIFDVRDGKGGKYIHCDTLRFFLVVKIRRATQDALGGRFPRELEA
jgi:hypothetical protein